MKPKSVPDDCCRTSRLPLQVGKDQRFRCPETVLPRRDVEPSAQRVIGAIDRSADRWVAQSTRALRRPSIEFLVLRHDVRRPRRPFARDQPSDTRRSPGPILDHPSEIGVRNRTREPDGSGFPGRAKSEQSNDEAGPERSRPRAGSGSRGSAARREIGQRGRRGSPGRTRPAGGTLIAATIAPALPDGIGPLRRVIQEFR